MVENTIPVIVEKSLEGRGMMSSVGASVRALEHVGSELLSKSFSSIVATLDGILQASASSTKATVIERMVINLEIRGDVGFSLIGSPSAGAKGSIEIVLRARESDDTI